MDRVLKTGLVERGWAQYEVDDAARAMREQQNPLAKRVFEGVVFWSILGVSIFANFVISLVLIPILMVVTETNLIIALFIVGFTFGALIETVLKETKRYEQSKLVIPELFIPAIAMINIYLATQLANNVAEMLLLPHALNNPVMTSLVYVIAFMLPHFIVKIRSHKTHVLQT